MPRVLIVSPHFPPVNAPDMQRVRLILPYLQLHGWEPVVLAVDPDFIEGGVREPMLESTYPANIRVIRVRGIAPRLTRLFGFGSLWFRCGRALARAGARLLLEQHFDLVFFSTTQFSAFGLGPKWRRRFGVPYVLDYQDPWYNDYYDRMGVRPPGGRLKHALGQWLAHRLEPTVLREASGLIAVSDSYGPMLARLYPDFDPARVKLLPFGASSADLASLGDYHPATPLIDFHDGKCHLVYAGRCGPDMNLALTVLFRAFRRFRESNPVESARILLHFIGTGYAPPPLGRDCVMPLALAEGVGGSVREHCYRVPYFDTLYYLQQAQALVAVGSNDATYSASKLFPYVLAHKPLLLIFHASSLVLALARQLGVGCSFGFQGPDGIDRLAGQVHQWFVDGGYRTTSTYAKDMFAPYTAERLTQTLCEIFAEAVNRHALKAGSP